jgi:hypothetical protein
LSSASYTAVALQRIAWAAAFVVGFPKVNAAFGLITATAGDFEDVADLHWQLAASLGNSKGLIVTPPPPASGALQPTRR